MADGKRLKIQGVLAFKPEPEGEAPRREAEGAEPFAAGSEAESPASTERLMKEVAEAENLRKALKRVLKLVREYLNAGVLEDGLVKPTEEGTPQGGPLSPLLSNIVLDKLDKELEKRGHRFVRYADDCNIYVKSERAGQRVRNWRSTFMDGEPISDSAKRHRY